MFKTKATLSEFRERLGNAFWFLIISAVSVGLHFLFSILSPDVNAYKLLDGKILDAEFSLLRQYYPRPIQKEVVLIGIDVTDLRSVQEPLNLWHPHLGKLMEILSETQMVGLGLDIALPEQSYNEILPNYDVALLQGIVALNAPPPSKQAQPVSPDAASTQNSSAESSPPVTPADKSGAVDYSTNSQSVTTQASSSAPSPSVPAPRVSKAPKESAKESGESRIILGQVVDTQGSFRDFFPPFIAVAGGEKSVGSLMVCGDPDRVLREFNEFLCDKSRGQSRASVVGRLAERMGVYPEPDPIKPNLVGWGGLVDYSIGDKIKYIPFRKVLEWGNNKDKERLKIFNGKPVFLGTILPFEDRRTIPVDLAEFEPSGQTSVPGVLFHVQALRSILNGGLINSAPLWVVLLLTVLSATLWFLTDIWRLVILPIWLLGLLVLAATVLYQYKLFIPIASPIVAAMVSVFARYAIDAARRKQERDWLRNSFGSYVSPQIMEQIEKGEIEPGINGKKMNICVQFSDIRQFTYRAEMMQPDELNDFLNKYFTAMTHIIHAHGGTVDKFIGDGIMVFYGAPSSLENNARSAVEASLQMLERAKSLSIELKLNPPLAIGIGLHLGEATVGHFGSDERHEYTAIGDTVNLASRVESLTKEKGCALLVTKSVLDQVPQLASGFVPLGNTEVRGHTPVDLYGTARYEVDFK